MKQNKIQLLLAVLVFGLLGTGCHRRSKPVPESMLTGQATIAADEALQPLLQAEIDVFRGIYNYASVDCKFVSEYDAINLLLQEKIRLALATRPLTANEVSFFAQRNIVPESIPLAYDAIAVIVHPENRLKVLTTRQINQMLSGELTDWKQVAASGKSGIIQQVFDAESSGIIRSLNDSLHLDKKISGHISFAGNSQNVIRSVAANPQAIGFVGFNWLSETENLNVQGNLKKLNLLAISLAASPDSTNSFKPSVASLYNMKYPLIRRVYAIYTDPSASLARGFLAHLTSERGQKVIYRMGLKPENNFQRLVNINKENL